MAADEGPRIDAARFPTLAEFVQGYLHQDFEIEHGALREAVRAWRDDVDQAAAQQLLDEWRAFLAATRGWNVAARADALIEDIGGAWAPQTRHDLATLSRALIAARRRR